MMQLPEESELYLEIVDEGVEIPIEESIDLKLLQYNLECGLPPITPEFYGKFARIYGTITNKHPLEILQELKGAYFRSAIYDSKVNKRDFSSINKYKYLEWLDKQIKMIDEARFLA